MGGWSELVPRFEYLVDDLTTEREESLMARPGPPVVRLALLLLAYGRTEELEQRLPGWAALVAQVYAGPQGVDDLKVVFHYLLRVADPPAQQAAVGMLKSAIGTQRAEDLMTTWLEEQMAQRFLAWNRKVKVQAKAEGKAEGKAEARAESVLRVLAARSIHVDDPSRHRILSCKDLATLDRWFDQALTATRLADVLDDFTQ